MANVFGDIKGINLLQEPFMAGNNYTAAVHFTSATATIATDTVQLGGGGTIYGNTTTRTLAQLISDTRRDGKTVTIKAAMRSEPGADTATPALRFFYADASTTVSASAGNLQSTLTDVAAANLAAAVGVTDTPVQVLVSYSLT